MLLLSGAAFIASPSGVRLPMQWGLNGRPTWRAPRLMAVLFAPALATAILLITSSFAANAHWVAMSVAAIFVVVHAGHLYFALRDVRRP